MELNDLNPEMEATTMTKRFTGLVFTLLVLAVSLPGCVADQSDQNQWLWYAMFELKSQAGRQDMMIAGLAMFNLATIGYLIWDRHNRQQKKL